MLDENEHSRKEDGRSLHRLLHKAEQQDATVVVDSAAFFSELPPEQSAPPRRPQQNTRRNTAGGENGAYLPPKRGKILLTVQAILSVLALVQLWRTQMLPVLYLVVLAALLVQLWLLVKRCQEYKTAGTVSRVFSVVLCAAMAMGCVWAQQGLAALGNMTNGFLSNAEANKITKEPFVVYLSGVDTRGDLTEKARSDVNNFAAVNPVTKLVVLITTGSQGEPLSALSRMASCSHRQVRVGPGDFIIISANPIPGNEKSVTKIVNGLLLLGAEVIYESMYDVHVSGHACQEEQKLMLTLTRPKYFLPVHGEYKQLKKHAITAASLGIPTSNILIAENGSNIILSQDEMKLGEPVTAGAVMVDGLGVGDVGNVVLRDRKHLSEDGLVIIVATVDSKSGKVLAGPDLVSRGFVYVRENESLMDGAQSIVENALQRCVDENVRDWNSVKTRVREALSSYIYRRTKRSPMILPILMEV